MTIHPTAIVSPDALIGQNTSIGPYCIIGPATRIGNDCEVGANCELGVDKGTLPGSPLEIGPGAIIRSGSIFYQGSVFGRGLRTGHKVTVREGTVAGEGLQIGTLSDIQGHCFIGNHVRLHSNVHIGQRSVIGNFVWIFPYVVLTNDPHPPSELLQGVTVDDFAVIASMSTILPGTHIGKGALVGAMSLVREDVPADVICVGVPGRNIGSTDRIKFKDSGKPVYPWRRHFRRGYPIEVTNEWLKEFPDG